MPAAGHLRSQRLDRSRSGRAARRTALDLGPHRDRRSLENRIAKPI